MVFTSTRIDLKTDYFGLTNARKRGSNFFNLVSLSEKSGLVSGG